MEAEKKENERLLLEEIARREREFEARLKVEQALVEAEQRRQFEIQRLADEDRIRKREAQLEQERKNLQAKLVSVR